MPPVRLANSSTTRRPSSDDGILQLIPHLYMFGAVVRVRSDKPGFSRGAGFFRRDMPCHAAGVVGFAMTALALSLAFVLGNDVTDRRGFEFKLLLGALGVLAPGVLIFRWNGRRRKVPPSSGPEQPELVSELP